MNGLVTMVTDRFNADFEQALKKAVNNHYPGFDWESEERGNFKNIIVRHHNNERHVYYKHNATVNKILTIVEHEHLNFSSVVFMSKNYEFIYH